MVPQMAIYGATGYERPAHLEVALAAGQDGVLGKPIGREEVLAVYADAPAAHGHDAGWYTALLCVSRAAKVAVRGPRVALDQPARLARVGHVQLAGVGGDEVGLAPPRRQRRLPLGRRAARAAAALHM